MSQLPRIIKTKVYLPAYLKAYYKYENARCNYIRKVIQISIDTYLRQNRFDVSKLRIDATDTNQTKQKHYIEITYPPRKSREEQSKSKVMHVVLPNRLTSLIVSLIKDAFYRDMLLIVNVQETRKIDIDEAICQFFSRFGITEEMYTISSARRQYYRVKNRYKDEHGAILV